MSYKLKERMLVFISVLLLFTSVLKEIRILSPFDEIFQLLFLVGVGIGLVLLALYFFQPSTIKANYLFWILGVGFVLSLTVSSFLYPQWRTTSIKETLVSMICILVIFPGINMMKSENKDRFAYWLLKCVLILVSLASLASVIVFFVGPNIKFAYLGHDIVLGLRANRLYGLYESLTLPIAGSCVLLAFSFKYNEHFASSKGDNFLFILSTLSNMLYVILAFSYGTIIALVAGISMMVFFTLRKTKHILTAAILSLLTIVIMVGGIKGSRDVIYDFVNDKRAATVDTGQRIENEIEQIAPTPAQREHKEIESDKIMTNGILSGRDTIWKFGIEVWKERPLIGYGAAAYYGFKVPDAPVIPHFHNVFVQSLVGGGILHSIFSYALILLIVYKGFKELFRRDVTQYQVALISFLAFSVVGGLVETNILYVNRFPQYIFWIVLGLTNLNLKTLRDAYGQ